MKKTMDVIRCAGCKADVIGPKPNQRYCTDRCKVATNGAKRATCPQCNRKVCLVLTAAGARCRQCTGVTPAQEPYCVPVARKDVRLPDMSNRQVVRLYLDAPDADIKDELEIRCRESGAVVAHGWIFTWNHAEDCLRPRRQPRQSHADAAVPAKPTRIFQHPGVLTFREEVYA